MPPPQRQRVTSRLYRRKDSPFIWAEYTPAGGGSPVRESTGCRDDGAARTWLAARELERVRVDAGVPVARPISLLEATAEYLVHKKPTWSPGWFITVDGFVANSVLARLGKERLVSSISRADVETFRAQEIGRPARLTRCCQRPWSAAPGGWSCSGCGEPAPADADTISDATVNRLMAAMAAFGEWCLVEGRGYHTANPWARHKPLAEDEVAVPDLEEEQLERVLRALEEPAELPQHGRRKYRYPWRLIVEFARETGLRKGELGRIRRDEVRDGVLFVTSSRARGRTKSRRMRPIPLSERALEVLERLPKRKDGLVFGKIGDPRAAFRTAAKAAGLERLWMHLWRHLFASRLAERGAGRHELRDAGGWSSSRMADRYTHARLDRLRALVGAPAAYGPRTRATPEKETGGSE
jgi:integrase